MGRCKIVIALVRFLDGKANDPILDTASKRPHVKPFLIVIIAAATDTIAVIGNDSLAAHRRTCLCPSKPVAVIVTDSFLISLGTPTRSKQVVHLALVEMVIPNFKTVIEPWRNIHRNFCLRQRRLDGRNNLIEIVATKGIVRNATIHLLKAIIEYIARNRILKKIRFNQPNCCLLRARILSQIMRHALSIGSVARKNIRPTRANRLGTISTMIIVISNIAIFIPLVLVVFSNHIGIKDWR